MEKYKQLRPGLWATVNERYPGSMITKDDLVPLAKLTKPLSESRLGFVSTSGVQPQGSLPFDTSHPIGDYTFRRVPSDLRVSDLEIHQLKYPTVGAEQDLNVIFPIERFHELVRVGTSASLPSTSFRSSVTIWIRNDSRKLWRRTSLMRLKRKNPISYCSRRPDRSAIRASRWSSVPLNEEKFQQSQLR